ncbi:hypothetical protein KXQ82_02095 [Mucilaginibacter sp. HMF5004]|uniref:hypothetical protein n=1 Tax=Mucilaginibacter rivuli TaxID=2857527 RepID=UPI001C5F3A09|nr:hypothetical protein [Mucilaginibacter rivuli]MBW4888482.1 hypothetical protein [Mucilaginibacter rivuli]
MEQSNELKTDITLEKYQGVPKGSSLKDKSNWRKFVEFFLPWLNEKRKLGERYLMAEVINKEADAMSKFADVELKNEQANRIRVETALLEKDKLEKVNVERMSENDITEFINSFHDKLKYLSAVKGLKIEIIITKEKAKD